jgi:hypothetical protein
MFRKCTLLVTLWLIMLPGIVNSEEKKTKAVDVLDQALQTLNITRAEMGFKVEDYWIYWPESKYTLPLKTYEFTRTLGNTISMNLLPDSVETKKNYLSNVVKNILLRAGFKVSYYGSNLDTTVSKDKPLLNVIKDLYKEHAQPTRYSTFGALSIDLEKELNEQIEKIPEKIQKPIAQLVYGMLEIEKWHNQAIRNIEVNKLQKVFNIHDYTATQADGVKYYPEVEDIADNIDFASLYYAAMNSVYLFEQVKKELLEIAKTKRIDLRNLYFKHKSPIGQIIISGSKDDVHDYNDIALLGDFGGNDTYGGAIGASSLEVPVSIAIDVSGNDSYTTEEQEISSQGAGILGVGILADLDGNDAYKAFSYSQGLGFFGFGLLYDEKGKDEYHLKDAADQGAGIFGIGTAIDIEGKDYYYCGAEAQGYGTSYGIGILANVKGDDKYIAETDPKVIDRADYHADHEYNGSSAQGAGMGRRGDGSDGHLWSGGLGALIDIEGNDFYSAGTFSQGIGYWFGAGLLYDESGNDTYKSIYFTQGSGAHYAIGALIDEGGDDIHDLYHKAGAALGFGWDVTVALFLDKNGNDKYKADMISIGCAEINSIAMFLDLSGNDSYTFPEKGLGLGASDTRGEINPEIGDMRYRMPSIGVFIDIHGSDTYSTATHMGNDKIWLKPTKDEWENIPPMKLGVGIDTEEGTIPEFFMFNDQ